VYPFSPNVVGQGVATPPVLINGYQTELIAPHAVITPKNSELEPCPATIPARDIGQLPPKCFTWRTGGIRLHAYLKGDAQGYKAVRIFQEMDGPSVEARPEALESEPPRHRPLARHFTNGLYIAQPAKGASTVVHFRLFELQPDGSDFMLYQTAAHDLAVHDGAPDAAAFRERLLRAVGGFVGNGPGRGLVRPPYLLGTPLFKGGDGRAERRYLEAVELVTFQMIRHARWLHQHVQPRLFLGYLNYPDEMEHNWKGIAQSDPRYHEFRRWGYVIVNRAARAYAELAGVNDQIVFVSDHGMAPVTHEVRVNAVLRAAGLLGVNGKGELDPATTKVMHLRNCLLVNTTDWKGGLVPPAERGAVLKQALDTLQAVRDPETQRAVITRVFASEADAKRFGFGGPNGGDACFDLAPGYASSDELKGAPVTRAEVPIGYHGFVPTRPEMHAILLGAGPRLPRGRAWPTRHSIDVAPLVADLLGIQPPRDARGTSPLRRASARKRP
jgi:hypothetical protein